MSSWHFRNGTKFEWKVPGVFSDNSEWVGESKYEKIFRLLPPTCLHTLGYTQCAQYCELVWFRSTKKNQKSKRLVMPCVLSTWNSSWAACWNEIGILLSHFRSAYRCSHVKLRRGGVLLTVDTWPVVELPHHSVQWPGQKWAVQRGQIDHLDNHARSRACQTSYVKFKRCHTSSTQKTWVEMQSGAFFLFSLSLSSSLPESPAETADS